MEAFKNLKELLQGSWLLEHKNWGSKWCISQSIDKRVDLLFIKAGGYSSKHLHTTTSNSFFLLVGELQIITFEPHTEDSEDLVIKELNKDDVYTLVPKQTQHRFRALTDVMVLEITEKQTSSAFIDEDIYRFDEGGIEDA